jgi:hypothetical protein
MSMFGHRIGREATVALYRVLPRHLHPVSHVLPDGSKERPVSGILPLHSPEASVPLLPCLCNPIITIYHVISPSSSCLGKKTLRLGRLGIEGWKLVFCLPAVNEGGGGILFRLCMLNSFWILVPVVEGEGLPTCNERVGSIATRVLLGF